MNSLKRVETEIEIEFESFQEADTILRSIQPEIQFAPSDRSSVKAYIKEDNTLRIQIDAQDSASFRASINSYLRWIILSYNVLNLK